MDDADDWCSINEAARRLGITATAIRQRIKRGTLDTRPRGNYGREVRVPRPSPGTVSLTAPLTVTDTVPPTSDAVDRIMDTLVAELRGRLAELQSRVTAAEAERIMAHQEAAQERSQAAQERERLQAVLADTGHRLARLTEAREADLRQHHRTVDELQRELSDLRRRPWWRRVWAA
jgi:polyhydroxyalkanoate synthesis regulator phasin